MLWPEEQEAGLALVRERSCTESQVLRGVQAASCRSLADGQLTFFMARKQKSKM